MVQKYFLAVMAIWLVLSPPVRAKSVECTDNGRAERPPSDRKGADGVTDRKEAFETTAAAAGVNECVEEWFGKYDEVRRKAQMSSDERAKADKLKRGKWKLVIPGFARIQARSLLKKMIERYEAADTELSKLPSISETAELQEGYARFFREARLVFEDYLRLLSNPFARGADGKPLRKSVRQKKGDLEDREKRIKDLDYRLRKKHGIGPYWHH